MSETASDSTSLCHKIRYAEEPDNPELLHRWLALAHLTEHQNSRERWQTLVIQYRLLIATLSDAQLPLAWRCHCLENIYQPLRELEKIAQSDTERREARRLHFETRMMALCCLPQRH